MTAFEKQVPAERHSRRNRQRSAGRLFVGDRTGVRERLVHRSIRAESARLACTPYRMPQPNSVSTPNAFRRSEEHTSELQSPCNLVCRLLLEKKKKQQ